MRIPTSFEESKLVQRHLHDAVKRASDALDVFPKGPTGLTPNNVRFTAPFRAARDAFNLAFGRLRSFNAEFTKTFRTEIRAARAAKAGSRG